MLRLNPPKTPCQGYAEDLRKAAETSALVSDESRRISIRKWNEFAYLRAQFQLKPSGELSEEAATRYAASAVFGIRANDAIDAIKISKISK